jgi:nucleoside-diphosphate-sugar epimerase
LVARLAAGGGPVIAAARQAAPQAAGIVPRLTGTLSAATDWPALLGDARTIVHLASRAHAPAETGDAWIAAEAATAASLARAAAAAGIERIVLLSSIKAHGEDSGAGRFHASDPLAPADAYGRAKVAIEAAMSAERCPLVVLRPPLVYGPGVKANFRALLGAVARGLPLPLASVANRRSLVFLDNLVDLVAVALTHERAPGGAFLLRDDDEVSTPDLVRLMARSLDRPARLFPFPRALLGAAARISGRGAALLGSLTVDDSATRATLGWHPRVTLAEGIAATCRWYRGDDGRTPASRL